MAEVGNFRGLQAANKTKNICTPCSLWRCLCGLLFTQLLHTSVDQPRTLVPIAVGFSLVSVWGSYYGSDRLVLTMTGAKLITEDDNPKLI
jgi:heat shock protein HtpX